MRTLPGEILLDFNLGDKTLLADSLSELAGRRVNAVSYTHLDVYKRQVIVKGEDKNESIVRARELLAKVGLNGKENSYPRRLSGGQQQRVAIALALAMRPLSLIHICTVAGCQYHREQYP